MAVDLFQDQIVAWRAAQAEGEGNHGHGQGQGPGSRQPADVHGGPTDEDPEKTGGEKSDGADPVQQPGAGQGPGHDGYCVRAKK